MHNFIERDDFDYRNYVVVSGVARFVKEFIVHNTSEYFGASFITDKKTHVLWESILMHRRRCTMHICGKW